MKKSKLNQAGFGIIEGLLIIIIILLIGFIGYYVLHTQNQADKDLKTTTKSTISQKPTIKDVQPVYNQGGVTLYDLSELAQTNDQKQIVSVIKEKCYTDTTAVNSSAQRSAVIVTGSSKDSFTDSSIFATSNGYARLVAGCSTKPVQPEDGSAVFILQKDNSKWSILTAGQQVPSCSDVDSKQIPATIVPECYDEGTTQNRAPKQ